MPKRRRRSYPTDLTDSQWALIALMIPDASPGGRPRKADKREIVEAILYLLRAGCAWRLLPHDFPLADGLLLSAPLGIPFGNPAG